MERYLFTTFRVVYEIDFFSCENIVRFVILVHEAQDFPPIWYSCILKALNDPLDGDLLIVCEGDQGEEKFMEGRIFLFYTSFFRCFLFRSFQVFCFREHCDDSLPENRKIHSDRLEHRLVIYTKIVVHDLIPHPCGCLPGNIRVFLSQLRGEILRGFTNDALASARYRHVQGGDP